MTDLPGRTARWNAAMILVPGTAAVFGAAVAWAAGSSPTTPAPVPVAVPPAAARSGVPAPGSDAFYLSAERRIAARLRNAAHLQRQLAALRGELDRATAQSRRQGQAGSGVAAGGGAVAAGPAPAPVAPAPVAPAPVAPPAAAPAPPPAPPVHTTTGASK